MNTFGRPAAFYRRFAGPLAVVFFGLSIARAAGAQDVASADALFKRGVSDMKAGKFDTACPAISESYRLDPSLSVRFTEAECMARAGRFATAVALYSEFFVEVGKLDRIGRKKHKKREEVAGKKKAELEPLVPELTLLLAAGAPEDVVVKRNGAIVGRAALGVALPVDPGDHVVTTQVPGGAVREHKIALAKSEKKKLELAVEAPPPPLPVPAPVLVPVESTPPTRMAPDRAPPPPPPPPPSSPANGRAPYIVAGLVLGGVGIAVGATAGVMALGKKSTVSQQCDSATRRRLCSQEGKNAGESGKTLANVSTIGFGVGILGVSVAAVLHLTRPAETAEWRPEASAGPDGLRLGVTARFLEAVRA